MRDFPLNNKQLLVIFMLFTIVSGALLDHFFGKKLDYWIHDTALIYQARSQWKHSAIVVLDNDVPISVGRKQALPLFALAADRLIATGTKAVYLDGRITKELDTRMPYAQCINPDGNVQWSSATCSSGQNNACSLVSSELARAPLAMGTETIQRFYIAPYLPGQNDLPDFLLYGLDASFFIPERGLVASDHLLTKNSATARWFSLDDQHAINRLGSYIDIPSTLTDTTDNDICDEGLPCRRIRLSQPMYKINLNEGQMVIPVSTLASCDIDIAKTMAKRLAGRVIVFQLSGPTEMTDMIITTMTTAFFGPQLLTPGAQYLVDSIETFLNNDHPRAPNQIIRITLFITIGIISVIIGAYLKPVFLWLFGAIVLFSVSGLCFINTQVQLWPVTVAILTTSIGSGLTISWHLFMGTRHGRLMANYMPKQVRNLLLTLKQDDGFQNSRCNAIVLMSDVAGYTTITGLLGEPENVLNLMNDYLGDTSIVLQDEYNGWLEGYVGDMVCYYWPFQLHEDGLDSCRNALLGSLALAELQKDFFATITERYHESIEQESLSKISSVIDAGIGLSVGHVVMGDLGPKQGVRKFGILGDPLNLASRIEGLTRFFNTEIMVTSNFLDAAKSLDLVVRKLGLISVKGRDEPETMYAVGIKDDPRFSDENVQAWERWLNEIEANHKSDLDCPDIFKQDKDSICLWLKKDLLKADGAWHLDEK